MAQFSVYHNRNADTAETIPYLLDIQNELLDRLSTRVVIPLYRREAFSTPAGQLNPCLELEGQTLVMATQELAGVPLTILGPEISNLSSKRDIIIAAIDLLITGF
jgi:toxin CcdB